MPANQMPPGPQTLQRLLQMMQLNQLLGGQLIEDPDRIPQRRALEPFNIATPPGTPIAPVGPGTLGGLPFKRPGPAIALANIAARRNNTRERQRQVQRQNRAEGFQEQLRRAILSNPQLLEALVANMGGMAQGMAPAGQSRPRPGGGGLGPAGPF